MQFAVALEVYPDDNLDDVIADAFKGQEAPGSDVRDLIQKAIDFARDTLGDSKLAVNVSAADEAVQFSSKVLDSSTNVKREEPLEEVFEKDFVLEVPKVEEIPKAASSKDESK